jgi:antiviral helicase SKI2
VQKPSSANKQCIVLMLRPDVPSTMQTPLGKKNVDFGEGSFLLPKSKRGIEDDYLLTASPRKGTGAINIKLPHHGSAVGMSYEVRGVDNKEFSSICKCKIKIEHVRLLEDGSTAAFSKTVQQLLGLQSNGNKYPPPLDPREGMVISQ